MIDYRNSEKLMFFFSNKAKWILFRCHPSGQLFFHLLFFIFMDPVKTTKTLVDQMREEDRELAKYV